MNKKYQVSEQQKKEFAALYLLDYMARHQPRFPLLLDENDQWLESLLEQLLIHRCIEIVDRSHYAVAKKGKTTLEKFAGRYSEYLTLFDIYSAVDLRQGTFAFADYFNFTDDQKWASHLAQDCWDDLRLAVAEYKGINPIEIVFMSFMQEKRFGRAADGWQFDLLLGTVWDEIVLICNSAISVADLAYDDINGEAVISDVIGQGHALLLELLAQEIEGENVGDRTVSFGSCSSAAEQLARYRPYADPRYRGAVWQASPFAV